MKKYSFARSDAAENSIMQTIVVAVSSIMVASGLVTAPGIINNARDSNAMLDVTNIAYVQEFALSDQGKYFDKILPGEDGSMFDFYQSNPGIKYTLSGNIGSQGAIVCDNPWSYLIKAESPSHKTFYRSSESGETTTSINDLTIAACIIDQHEYPDFVSGSANTDTPPVFPNVVLNPALVNAPYSYTFVALSDSKVTYKATSVPAGMSFNNATGVLSGTPTDIGTSTLTITATNNKGKVTVSPELVVGTPPVLSLATALTPTNVGANYTQQITATAGYPVPTYTATGLPGGLTIGADGLIHGSPTSQATSAPVTITATNYFGSDTKPSSITVGAAYLIPSFAFAVTLPNGQVGVPYNYQVNANGNPTPGFTATGLPSGLSISNMGVVSGIPATAVVGATVTITATNVTGSASAVSTMSVIPAYTIPAFGSNMLPSGRVGVAYPSTTITATGNPMPTFTATGLPNGLSISNSGVISGTPTATKSGNVVITATNAAGSSTATLPLTIEAAYIIPSFGSFSLPDGRVGAAYGSSAIPVTANPSVVFTASGLPVGLSINSSTGIITGTPTNTNAAPVNITATNAAGSASVTVSLNVLPAYTLPAFTSALTPPNGQVGVTYAGYDVIATGNPTPTFSATGLPAGLSINSTTGRISGIPTTAVNNAAVTVRITNINGFTAANATITIIPAYSVPSISSFTLANGNVGTAYTSSAPVVTGYPAPTFSATGLPAGLSINSTTGVISGTPTASGTQSVTLTASNVAGSTSASTIINIYAAPSFGSVVLPNGQTGAAYNYAVAVDGYPVPTLTATGLPTGLTMASNGSITGTPAAPSNSTVVITATNTAGSASVTVSLKVNPVDSVPTLRNASIPNGYVGTPLNPFSTANTGFPVAYAASNLPDGLSIDSSTGVISGTPTTAGTKTVTVTGTNYLGTATRNYSITILNAASVSALDVTIKTGGSWSGLGVVSTNAAAGGTWSTTGNVPAGLITLALGNTLVVTGLVGAVGEYNFTYVYTSPSGYVFARPVTYLITL